MLDINNLGRNTIPLPKDNILSFPWDRWEEDQAEKERTAVNKPPHSAQKRKVLRDKGKRARAARRKNR